MTRSGGGAENTCQRSSVRKTETAEESRSTTSPSVSNGHQLLVVAGDLCRCETRCRRLPDKWAEIICRAGSGYVLRLLIIVSCPSRFGERGGFVANRRRPLRSDSLGRCASKQCSGITAGYCHYHWRDSLLGLRRSTPCRPHRNTCLQSRLWSEFVRTPEPQPRGRRRIQQRYDGPGLHVELCRPAGL